MTGLNRTDAARRLLADVDAWCARTATAETKIGVILFRHAGFVGLLRKRLTVTEEKEGAVREFFEAHPDGAADVATPHPRLRSPRVQPTHHSAPAPISPGAAALRAQMERAVVSEPVHQAEAVLGSPARPFKPLIPAAVLRACKEDGRPLPQFCTDLLLMGLDCWRDDRALMTPAELAQ